MKITKNTFLGKENMTFLQSGLGGESIIIDLPQKILNLGRNTKFPNPIKWNFRNTLMSKTLGLRQGNPIEDKTG